MNQPAEACGNKERGSLAHSVNGPSHPGTSANDRHIILVENLSHFFEIARHEAGQSHAVKALDDVSVAIPGQHFVSIVGPSGCGKTTLLNIMAGLEDIQAGTVRICGTSPAAGRRDIAYMPARDALLPWRTVQGNAGFGLEIHQESSEKRERVVADLLAAVGLRGFERARPRQLSHGMRQRVALARTFALGSEILLMDEPFGALDAQTKQQLQGVLLKLWEHDRRTVVLVTHDLQEALALSDRIIVVSARPGRIKASFEIDIPRPRNVGELLELPKFISLYREIRSLVEETQQ